MIGHTYLHRIKCQRTFTYYVSGSLAVWLTSCFVGLDLASCWCWIRNILTCLAESKPVEQEFSHTVILALEKCSLFINWFKIKSFGIEVLQFYWSRWALEQTLCKINYAKVEREKRTLKQCDQMAKSFFQCLPICNNENLPNSIKISHSKFKILPKT